MRFRIMAARLAACTILSGALATVGHAQQPIRPTGAAVPPQPDTQAQARTILMRMASFVSSAPRFSVSLTTSYDTLQASGQKIEFGERRKLVLNRPARLRVETERSDGARTAAVFTGTEMVLIDATNKVYASEPQPGDLDESILHFVSDLGMRLPLAALLMRRLPDDLTRRVRSIDYVEKTNLLGPPSHHLAARGDTVDMQVWIADGPRPVPLRIVLTYKTEPGQPEFRAQFAEWDMAPAINEGTFQPQIPPGSHKIQFAAQLAAAAQLRRQGGKP